MVIQQQDQTQQLQGSAMETSPPNLLDTDGLCLLSIDGGGVRGLASLYILKSVMDRLNAARHDSEIDCPRLKPCDVFDLIGGTSTGGYDFSPPQFVHVFALSAYFCLHPPASFSLLCPFYEPCEVDLPGLYED